MALIRPHYHPKRIILRLGDHAANPRQHSHPAWLAIDHTILGRKGNLKHVVEDAIQRDASRAPGQRIALNIGRNRIALDAPVAKIDHDQPGTGRCDRPLEGIIAPVFVHQIERRDLEQQAAGPRQQTLNQRSVQVRSIHIERARLPLHRTQRDVLHRQPKRRQGPERCRIIRANLQHGHDQIDQRERHVPFVADAQRHANRAAGTFLSE